MLNNKVDAKTKLHILDLFDERPIEVIDALDPENNCLSIDKLQAFMAKPDPFLPEADRLDHLIVDNLVEFLDSREESAIVSRDTLLACRSEAKRLAQEGCLREAAFGRHEKL